MPLKHIYISCTLLVLSAFALSCSHSTASQASARKEIVHKYSPDELREDFDVMRNILEKFHPSLYWYTSKDSMDMLFNATTVRLQRTGAHHHGYQMWPYLLQLFEKIQ
jgi:hypothetical protein